MNEYEGPSGRLIAIGDVHGCSLALHALLGCVAPDERDTIVLLGDLIDRGSDSKGVLDQVVRWRSRCQCICLRGNHEEMFLRVLQHPSALQPWLLAGGSATLDSYGFGCRPEELPAEHLDVIRSAVPFYETSSRFFVHANYHPGEPLADQSTDVLCWRSLEEQLPGPHVSGKLAVVGHTSQKNGEILDLGHLKCIDTHCYGGGWLTAVDAESGQVWQVNREGVPRNLRI